MTVAQTTGIALLGLAGSLVEIEADISDGLPGFVLIGLPDTSLNEARERVRAAASNSGCPLPPRKLTINLSPAALPKHGSSFDLAIAVACLAADGQLDPASIGRVVHIGELALDGRLRPIPGILPSVLAATRLGAERVMVPVANVDEAELVPDIDVVGVASLRDAAIWHGADFAPEPVDPLRLENPDETPTPDLELSDVVGNGGAIDGLIAAAAGGHHLLMIGPPGAGKSMLAARLPGLLPELTVDAALEVASIRSLCGLPVGASLLRRPPFESPHHTTSASALVGGGTSQLRPGAASRASRGVLFLDEAPEFNAHVLDALRQPLESGRLEVMRTVGRASFPTRFQLVMAANPCPCGQYGSRDVPCTCTPHQRRRYLARLSGPLIDRIDVQLRVSRIDAAQLRLAGDGLRPAVSTATARSRVDSARAASAARWAQTPWRLNSEIPGTMLRSGPFALPLSDTAAIDRALEGGSLTMRGYDRVLRLAWTLADLAGCARPSEEHVHGALALRRAL